MHVLIAYAKAFLFTFLYSLLKLKSMYCEMYSFRWKTGKSQRDYKAQ